MSNLPTIAVLIPTYNRPDIVRTCILRLQEFFRYEGPLVYLVSDDSSPDLAAQTHQAVELRAVSYFVGPHNGLGANLNYLHRLARDAGWFLTFQMDDDYWLNAPLDLTPHAKKLIDDPTVGVIRLMGIAGHHYVAHLRQGYWHIRWDSPELYIASNRPHLAHSRFYVAYGLYPEGLRLGHTEEAFCHQCRDIYRDVGGPDVVIPLDVPTESAWMHVGDSWQLKGL